MHTQKETKHQPDVRKILVRIVALACAAIIAGSALIGIFMH
jgi:hypothetical protein